MSTEVISFRQSRDVGDVITATFNYLRQNWRSLGKGLLYIAGPALAVQLFVSSLFQSRFFALMQPGNPSTPEDMGALYAEVLGPMLLMLPVSMLVAVLAVSVVYEHMRLYQGRGPQAAVVAAVWKGVKRSFWTMAGTALGAFLVGLAAFTVVVMAGALVGGGLSVGIGPVGAGLGVLLMMLGFVGVGAYLLVVLALLFPVRMYEEVGLVEGFRRCLHLLEDAFWRSLGVVFVVVLLYYVLATAFSMPASILGFMWGFNTASGADAGGMLFEVALVAANVVGGLGSTVAYCIPLVAAGLYYFGLVEEKEHVGLAARVEQVGERMEGEHGNEGSGRVAPPAPETEEEPESNPGSSAGNEPDDPARWQPPEERSP